METGSGIEMRERNRAAVQNIFIAFGRGHTVFSRCIKENHVLLLCPKVHSVSGLFPMIPLCKIQRCTRRVKHLLAHAGPHYVVKKTVPQGRSDTSCGGRCPKAAAGFFPGSQMML